MKKSHGFRILRFVMIFSAVFVLVWSVWPAGRIIRILRLDPIFIDRVEREPCDLLGGLMDYTFILNYPASIRLNDKERIIISLVRDEEQGPPQIARGVDNLCAVALEVMVEMPSANFQPGPVILEPFVYQQSQNFIVSISDAEKISQLSGDIWISALISLGGSKIMDRIPLFAFPIEIDLVSIFGFQPGIIKYFSIGILLIFLVAFSPEFIKKVE